MRTKIARSVDVDGMIDSRGVRFSGCGAFNDPSFLESTCLQCGALPKTPCECWKVQRDDHPI